MDWTAGATVERTETNSWFYHPHPEQIILHTVIENIIEKVMHFALE